MRRGVRFALPALLLVAVLAVPGGGVASSYTIVPGGPPVTVSTTAADENVNVNFTGTAGARISVKLTSVTFGTSTCCSTRVSVRKPDGTNLVAPTNVGRNGGFLDVKTLPVSGSYRIFIDPQGTVTGSMVVTLYDVPPDASVTTTPGGAPVSVATTIPGQNAAATFSGSAGQRIGLKMTNVTIGTSTTASTKVSLLKPDGTTLVAPMNVGTRGGFLEAVLPTAGTYKVFIDPLTTSTGGMTLTLYDVPGDVVAPITPGGAPLTLTTTVPAQNAKATFTGALNQRVSLKIGPVSLTTSADTAKVSITKPDGTALVSAASYSSVGGFVDLKVLPVAGTYTIVVDPQSAATGSVTLTLYDVPPDVVVPITFAAPVTVTTTTPGQNARATFTGAAGQQVGVQVTSVTVAGSTKVSLLRPDGTALKSLTVGTGGGTLTPSVLPVAGVYTVLVDPQSSATGSVRLTLQDVAPDITGSILPDGNPVTVTTTTASQNARLTFSGTAGQAVSMKMKYAPATCCTANVSLLKPDGTILNAPIGVGTVEKFMDAKTLPITGIYTILVDPQGTSTGTMTLTLYLVPGDVTASITPGGPPVTVTTTAAGQNARLTFAGTAGDGVVVTIGPACCATTVSILKPDGTTLVSPKAIAIAGGKIYTRLTVTGTHTILVDYQSTAVGSVTVQLSIDNTAPAVPVLSLLEPTADSHATGTSFFYRPAGAGGSLTVTATTSDGGAGVQKVNFPGLSGGFTPTGVTSDLAAPYSRVYTWVTGATLTNAALAVTVFDNVGNTSSATFAVRPDSAAPTTTDNTAAIGSAWKNTNQTVTLTPSDGTGSGVAATHYTTNGATPTTASPQGTSVALTADGVYTVKYFSLDNVANAEAVKTAGTQIRIDKTPPASATLNALPASIRNGQTLSGAATDALSGIVSLSYLYCAGASCTPSVLIGSSSAGPSYPVVWTSQPPDGTYQVLARATDAAGNILNSAKQTVVVDNSPPDTTITAAPASPSTASVSFSFTSTQAGSTFECELDGSAFAACTSPKPYTSLSGGSHTFRVRATDPAGNVDATPAAHTWTVDAVAPNTTITANPPALSNSASASFSFTSTEAGTFECRLDAAAFGACTSPHGYTGLTDGSHTFSVRAIDTAGNVDPSAAAYTWTVDTGAPETSITSSPSNPSSSANASFSFLSSEAGSSFHCQLDGSAFAPCTSPQSYGGLTDGSHTFSVRATDPAGNVDATPASYTWTVDTAAPNTTITANPPASSNSANASFSFTSTEAGTFECRLDAGAFGACTSPHGYTGLTDGSHTFSVRAIDAAGNVDATPAAYTWTVDTAAPNTTITASPTNPSSSAAASFSFTATEAGSTFECALDGGGFGSCASPQGYSGLSDGSHTFLVRATDASGNTDATPASHTWTVDTAAPAASITGGPSDPSNDPAPTLTFTADEGGSSFECRLDGGSFSSCTSPHGLSGLTEGPHTFTVRAIDGAGNTGPGDSRTWTVDLTAPDTTISSGPSDPTVDTFADFAFDSSEAGSTFQCELDGGGFDPCTSPQSYAGLTTGVHTFSVYGTDAAGNVDSTPATFTWTIS